MKWNLFVNNLKNYSVSVNKNTLRKVKRLENFCMKEVYDMEMCHTCYYKSNTQTQWFTAVCDPPHLLVWTRINHLHEYAPAKVLGLTGGTATSKKIDVRFFGDHEMSVVPSSNCYLFSKRKPHTDGQTDFQQKAAERVRIHLYAPKLSVKCSHLT